MSNHITQRFENRPRAVSRLVVGILAFSYSCFPNLLPAATAAQAPADLISSGLKAYSSNDFEAAHRKFSEAARRASEKNMDPSVPEFDLGTTLYRLRRFPEAAAAFRRATRSENISLQSSAYYNAGRALAAQGDAETNIGNPEKAIQAFHEASELFKQALLLNADDNDAKVNYELALRKKNALQRMLRDMQKKRESSNPKSHNQQPRSAPTPQNPSAGNYQNRKESKEKTKRGQKKSSPDKQASPRQQRPSAAASQTKTSPSESVRGARPSQPSHSMTREEAIRLLNAMREQENAGRRRMKLIIGRPIPVEKDW